MKKATLSLFIFLSAVLVSSHPVFANALTCANSEGSLVHSTWHYRGGPQPYPGMVLSRESWKLNDVILFEQVVRQSRPTPVTDFTSSWDESSKVILDDSEATRKPTGQIIYAQRVRLQQPEKLDLTAFVICTHVFDTIPRP